MQDVYTYTCYEMYNVDITFVKDGVTRKTSFVGARRL